MDNPVLAGCAPLEGNLLRGTVQAGFPSPAEDLGAQRIDLAQLLIKPSVDNLGNGLKRLQCTMWPAKLRELRDLVGERSRSEQVFLNQCGQRRLTSEPAR